MAEPQGGGPGQIDLVLPRARWLAIGLLAGAVLFSGMSLLAIGMAGLVLWVGAAQGTGISVLLIGAVLLPVLAWMSWQQAQRHHRGGLVMVLRPEGVTLPPSDPTKAPLHIPWKGVARIERQRLRHDLRYHLILADRLLRNAPRRIRFDLAQSALPSPAFEDALHRMVAAAGLVMHPARPGAAARLLHAIDAVWNLAPAPPHR